MPKERTQLSRFGEPATLVLLSLTSGAKHGYALMQDIDVELGFKLGPGTLYGAISKLMDLRMIRRLECQDRAKPYEITDLGKTVLADYIRLWAPVIKLGEVGLA